MKLSSPTLERDLARLSVCIKDIPHLGDASACYLLQNFFVDYLTNLCKELAQTNGQNLATLWPALLKIIGQRVKEESELFTKILLNVMAEIAPLGGEFAVNCGIIFGDSLRVLEGHPALQAIIEQVRGVVVF